MRLGSALCVTTVHCGGCSGASQHVTHRLRVPGGRRPEGQGRRLGGSFGVCASKHRNGRGTASPVRTPRAVVVALVVAQHVEHALHAGLRNDGGRGGAAVFPAGTHSGRAPQPSVLPLTSPLLLLCRPSL
jgi:hypothetical protein